jgi:hypothetical protein
LKKKVRAGCEIPEADMQKPYMRQNVSKQKQKSTCFRIFYKNRLNAVQKSKNQCGANDLSVAGISTMAGNKN